MRRTALELDELAMVTGGHQAENKIPPAVREQIRAMAEICKSRGYSQKEAISLVVSTFCAYPPAEVVMIVNEVYKFW